MTATVHRCIKHLLLGLTFAAQTAHAGSFGVSPIRLDFDRSAKTGVITVSNDDEIRLSFQLKLFEWTQDAEGKDQYVENGDLIFFPQIMTLEPKEKRLVRVGTKSPAPQIERTYRLFIEEIPEVGEVPAQGTQVAVKLRFGVPIFVAPIKAEMSGAIEDAKLSKGEVQLRVRNTGNQHFRFEAISVKAGSASIGEVQGWYLLPGAARAYSIKVDKDACAKSGKLEISLNGDGLVMKRELDATPVLCRP
jgi:fimbrial chaperone protein